MSKVAKLPTPNQAFTARVDKCAEGIQQHLLKRSGATGLIVISALILVLGTLLHNASGQMGRWFVVRASWKLLLIGLHW